jgi:protease-4
MDFDAFLERRRLKRSLNLWRVLAIFALAGLVMFVAGKFDGFSGRDHIAVLKVSNIIVADPERSKALLRVSQDKSVKALIVHINSPGGTVVGGESLYVHLRRVSEKKPVVAVMSDLATSAGYMTAIAADHIIARRSSVTGSIGVIMQTMEFTELLGKIGIKPESIKSAPLKAQPNPLEPMSKKARSAAQAVVSDMFDMFVDMVVERRQLTEERVTNLADGRVYTGRQALKHGLIDAIGGEKEALDWLSKDKNINVLLPLKDVYIPRDTSFISKTLDNVLGKTFLSKRLRLDGMISLWHPNL